MENLHRNPLGRTGRGDRAEPVSKPFPRFLTRRVTGLDGLWDFCFLGDRDEDDVDVRSLAFPERHPVPSSFDAMPDCAGFRGLAAYRTRLPRVTGEVAFLEFEGVGFCASVFVGGKPVGGIRHGWTPFTVEVPRDAADDLVVLVDNRFSYARSPLHEEFFDFHHWGGILRSVWMHSVPAIHIVRVAIAAEPGRHIVARVTFSARPHGEPTFELDGVATVPARSTWDLDTLVAEFVPDGLAVWSPADPALHTLRVALANDDMVERFGIRSVRAANGRLWLNGEPLRLFGVNRHESFPNCGASLPTSQVVADLQLVRSLGGNFVRGSHYPQDQRFLDLCDELGVLVWEEGVGWGQRDRQLTDPDFQREHARMLEAMILRSINHPSVILWGFLNEAGTNSAACRPIFEETTRTIRSLDPTRLISYASMFPSDDLCFDLVDVISVNAYPGWYGCEDEPDPLGLVVPRLREIIGRLDRSEFAAKPFLLSEIGVEALPGWRDAFGGFFTEDYQADYLSIVVREFLENPRIAGLALWHFSDARTYRGGRSLMRPRAFNNKGVFDEYRKPKRSADALRTLMATHSLLAPPAPRIDGEHSHPLPDGPFAK